jgi:signal peptidase I
LRGSPITRLGSEKEPVALDGRVHGVTCFDPDGTLVCGWPEQHGGGFIEILPYPDEASDILARPIVAPLRSIIATAITLVIGVNVFLLGAAMYLGGYSLNVVTSGSMRPGLQPGDLVILQKIPSSSLANGDVIAYVPPDRAGALIHRIVSLRDLGGGTILVQTRGDANNADDPGPVLLGDDAYRLVRSVPLLGWLILIRPYVWLLLLAVLAAIGALWVKGVVPRKLIRPSFA